MARLSVESVILRGLVRGYQLLLSPILPPTCRHSPSCSAYAMVAIERFGALRGGWLALRRIGRCHPWGGAGYDPVPERIDKRQDKRLSNRAEPPPGP